MVVAGGTILKLMLLIIVMISQGVSCSRGTAVENVGQLLKPKDDSYGTIEGVRGTT